jgi:hypothetical protein
MARPKRFELLTPRFVVSCSNGATIKQTSLGICNVPRTEPPRGRYPLSSTPRGSGSGGWADEYNSNRRGSVVVAVLAILHVFTLVGAHVTRAAMRAIVVACSTPYIHSLARTAVTAVEVAKQHALLLLCVRLSDGGEARFIEVSACSSVLTEVYNAFSRECSSQYRANANRPSCPVNVRWAEQLRLGPEAEQSLTS